MNGYSGAAYVDYKVVCSSANEPTGSRNGNGLREK